MLSDLVACPEENTSEGWLPSLKETGPETSPPLPVMVRLPLVWTPAVAAGTPWASSTRYDPCSSRFDPVSTACCGWYGMNTYSTFTVRSTAFGWPHRGDQPRAYTRPYFRPGPPVAFVGLRTSTSPIGVRIRQAGLPPETGAASRALSCPSTHARSFHVVGVLAAVGSCTACAEQAEVGATLGLGTGKSAYAESKAHCSSPRA